MYIYSLQIKWDSTKKNVFAMLGYQPDNKFLSFISGLWKKVYTVAIEVFVKYIGKFLIGEHVLTLIS
jgi:hypothetical protein